MSAAPTERYCPPEPEAYEARQDGQRVTICPRVAPDCVKSTHWITSDLSVSTGEIR